MTERLAHCYIYYRIAAPHAAAARAAILATLRAMEQHCGTVGRLYEGESEPLQSAYSGVPPSVPAARARVAAEERAAL